MELRENFLKAIRENEKLIFKVAAFYTDFKEDRDDLVQEIIYHLWKSFPGFRSESNLSTWMYRVAMNVSVQHLKIKKKIPAAKNFDTSAYNIADTPPDGREEQFQQLRSCIKTLNLFDQGILLLYLESKSHEEIAAVVGISKSNVGTRLSRIKEKLKQKVAQQ